MFGEFIDDGPICHSASPTTTPSRTSSCPSPAPYLPGQPAWRSICVHLASQPHVILKSQQRGEPELLLEEKVAIARDLMQQSPSQFLFRFGRHLLPDHLCHFDLQGTQDPVVAHYLRQARDCLDQRKRRVQIRNRRWAAVQRLERTRLAHSSSSGGGGERDEGGGAEGSLSEYFTEAEMKRRNPLLYEQLVGRHLSEEEKAERTQDFNRADCRLTTIIYDHLDAWDEKTRVQHLQEQEDGAAEEDDDDSVDEAMEEGGVPVQLDDAHKTLLREEFMSSMYNEFVAGKDKTFNYKCVDDNEDYDLLDVEGHDKEEQYFDDEEPCEVSPDRSGADSPVVPLLCTDRRLLWTHQQQQQQMVDVDSNIVAPTTIDMSISPAEEGDAMPAVESLRIE